MSSSQFKQPHQRPLTALAQSGMTSPKMAQALLAAKPYPVDEHEMGASPPDFEAFIKDHIALIRDNGLRPEEVVEYYGSVRAAEEFSDLLAALKVAADKPEALTHKEKQALARGKNTLNRVIYNREIFLEAVKEEAEQFSDDKPFANVDGEKLMDRIILESLTSNPDRAFEQALAAMQFYKQHIQYMRDAKDVIGAINSGLAIQEAPERMQG